MLELADTSAWLVSRVSPDFRSKVADGEIATCDMVKLELLRGARNPREFDSMRSELDQLRAFPIGLQEWQRAIDVYHEICRRGPGNDSHRRVNHEDLLIAAAAESASMPVVHYDSHFETIAAVTGQATRWIAPRGSL